MAKDKEGHGSEKKGYANVPNSLMGFRKNGPNKGYHQEKYPHNLAQHIQIYQHFDLLVL